MSGMTELCRIIFTNMYHHVSYNYCHYIFMFAQRCVYVLEQFDQHVLHLYNLVPAWSLRPT